MNIFKKISKQILWLVTDVVFVPILNHKDQLYSIVVNKQFVMRLIFIQRQIVKSKREETCDKMNKQTIHCQQDGRERKQSVTNRKYYCR